MNAGIANATSLRGTVIANPTTMSAADPCFTTSSWKMPAKKPATAAWGQRRNDTNTSKPARHAPESENTNVTYGWYQPQYLPATPTKTDAT